MRVTPLSTFVSLTGREIKGGGGVGGLKVDLHFMKHISQMNLGVECESTFFHMFCGEPVVYFSCF